MDAVQLVEDQKHLCAQQSLMECDTMKLCVDEGSVSGTSSVEFDKYWSMMDGLDGDDAVVEKVAVNWCALCSKHSCQETDGYFVCKLCGDVGAPCINSDAEWRVFSKDEQKGDKSRCGEASSSYLSATNHAEGTIISCKWKESEQMRNARQFHKWNSSQSSGRNLYIIFDELQRHAYKNGFNNMIVEDTKHLYKETTDYHMFRGVNRKGLYAYCLYHTCKKKNVPRSIKEISKIFGLIPHVMTKGHTAFNKVLREHEKLKDRKLSAATVETNEKKSEMTDDTNILSNVRKHHTNHKNNKKCNSGSKVQMLAKPVDFVDRFCSQLELTADSTRHIKQMTEDVSNKRLVSDSPSLITAACMLIVFRHDNIELNSTNVQAVTNISYVTIDKCYKKLLVFYDDIILCLN